MSNDSQTVFEMRGVGKSFRRGNGPQLHALRDVSLAVNRGSFTVLTGPSGSGKTTLLALLGALDRPSAGAVLFLGRDLATYSDIALARTRRRMGFIFQDFSLIPGLPVWENITYPLIPRGVDRRTRFARAEELLTRFGLQDRLAARPRELSGGEQQRVALARALAGDPEVLLADEPTSNLDTDSGRQICAILQQLQTEGRTIIVASHEQEVIQHATRMVKLAAGRVVDS